MGLNFPLDTAQLEKLDFVDNGAPTVQADFVCNVDLIGSIMLFTSCYLRRTPGGVLYKDCAFYARFQREWVHMGLALTASKLGMSETAAIAGGVALGGLRH